MQAGGKEKREEKRVGSDHRASCAILSLSCSLVFFCFLTGAESMQAFHDRRALSDDAEADRARQLGVERAHRDGGRLAGLDHRTNGTTSFEQLAEVDVSRGQVGGGGRGGCAASCRRRGGRSAIRGCRRCAELFDEGCGRHGVYGVHRRHDCGGGGWGWFAGAGTRLLGCCSSNSRWCPRGGQTRDWEGEGRRASDEAAQQWQTSRGSVTGAARRLLA